MKGSTCAHQKHVKNKHKNSYIANMYLTKSDPVDHFPQMDYALETSRGVVSG